MTGETYHFPVHYQNEEEQALNHRTLSYVLAIFSLFPFSGAQNLSSFE